jgi:hypothetical protein
MRADRKPHIGEYDTKTNAICDLSQIPITSEQGRKWAQGGGRPRVTLLPVAQQNLIARMGQFGTILLKAGQNGQVALVHDGAAKFLNIVRAGPLLLRRAAPLLLLLLLLLSHGSGGSRQRQQSECKEKFTHRVPSSDGREFQPE